IVALLALPPPLRAPVRQAPAHLPGRCRRVEGFGVERAAGPLQKPVVVLVLGVSDGLHEVSVAPDPAHVLWGAGPCALQAERLLLPRLSPHAAHRTDPRAASRPRSRTRTRTGTACRSSAGCRSVSWRSSPRTPSPRSSLASAAGRRKAAPRSGSGAGGCSSSPLDSPCRPRLPRP